MGREREREEQLSELGEKVPAELRSSIEPKLAALKEKVAEPEPDVEALKSMTKDLQMELMNVGQAAYAAAGAGDAAAGGEEPHARRPNPDEVISARNCRCCVAQCPHRLAPR